ncbi:alpha/beta fold hydrolase [Candidatus Saccharibacteria bacterium]|nr:MAG: alpha/beta fold hydrolase [Candidatus Saccharibacteria bacterium]
MLQSLRLPTGSGLALAGLLTTPENKPTYPLVILLHGFTGWKEEKHIETLAEELARAGIAVLRIDAPGSGESEGTFENDYTMTNYISAVEDVLAWAQISPGIDPERIAIWGHSMGGFVALASAVRCPAIKAVCCCQPSSGPKTMQPGEREAWESTGWQSFSNEHFQNIRLPYSFYLERETYHARDEAPKLHIPSLFIAGTNDRSVSLEDIRKMASLAPEPTEYREFATTHGYHKYPEALNDITAATVEFFLKYLKATSTTKT